MKLWGKTVVGMLICMLASLTTKLSADTGKPITIGTSYELESSILNQTRRINVYLPPSYKKGDDEYPVLFLLDGGVKEDFIHIAGIASLAAEFRKIREFILVGIEGIDRYHELFHPSTVESDLKRLPTSGGAANFRSFIRKELLPYVKANFRINGETTIIGESAAGLFVVETFLRQPDTFKNYIAVSPSLWWNNQSLSKEAATLLQEGSFPWNQKLYLTIANEGEGMQEGLDRVIEAVNEHGAWTMDMTYRPMKQETHGTIFHPAALDAVRLIFAD